MIALLSDESSVKKKDVSPYVNVDDSVRSRRSHSRDRGDGYIGTTQEEPFYDAIRSAPERTLWMPSLKKQREWYSYTTGGCQIPLFDSSKLHILDVSASKYRTELELYIDVFSDTYGSTSTRRNTYFVGAGVERIYRQQINCWTTVLAVQTCSYSQKV